MIKGNCRYNRKKKQKWVEKKFRNFLLRSLASWNIEGYNGFNKVSDTMSWGTVIFSPEAKVT